MTRKLAGFSRRRHPWPIEGLTRPCVGDWRPDDEGDLCRCVRACNWLSLLAKSWVKDKQFRRRKIVERPQQATIKTSDITM